MMLSETEIQENWEKLIDFIETTFEGERKDKLLELYNSMADRLAVAPASGRVYFHSAFIGGYVYHVLNVIDIAKKMSFLWNSLSKQQTYTEEELLFTALNHDLGKVGDLDNDYYRLETEDWKLKRGIQFEVGENLQFMKVQDRSLYLLQHFGIKTTQTEYLGIMLHDGLYDEGNQSYFKVFSQKDTMRTMLPCIIHWADNMASDLERERWRYSPEGKAFVNAGGTVLKKHKAYKPKKKKKTFEDVFKTAGNTDDITVQTFDDIFKDLLFFKSKK